MLARRRVECSDRPVHQQHEVKGVGRSQTVHCQSQEQQGAYRERGIARLQYALPRVRSVAGNQQKENTGKQLGEPVDLPCQATDRISDETVIRNRAVM
jgi:hypothetical protein